MSRKNRPPIKKTPYERPERYARKKNRRDKNKRAPRKALFTWNQVPFGLIILAYFFVVTFTPNWMALDTNTTKFLTLSLLNLLSFGYLLSRPDIRRQPGVLMRFFGTRAGLAYGAFMLVVLLSFTQAINIHESILQFSKLFATFGAVFILSVVLMRDMRYVKLIAIAATLLLVFDSLSVYYYIGEFIEGNVRRISDIKSVYSNRNILSSALFVKIPFALYLWVFSKGWLKRLGLLATAMGMLATFFMATRGFYVGLMVVTLLFVTYSVVNYVHERNRLHLKNMVGYLGALVFAVLIFSVVQANLYPSAGRTTEDLTTQVASIRGDASTSTRVDSWMWSLDMIGRNPVLGVGPGNWKINILEYENRTKPDYIYLFKAHNDYVEVMAETGILGGLLYIAIFAMILWNLLVAWLKRQQHKAWYPHLFLAGTGLLFYGFDGLFNFPIDRPEIQILFALYLAIGIGVMTARKAETEMAAEADPAEADPAAAVNQGTEPERQSASTSESPAIPKQKQPMPRVAGWSFSALMLLIMLGVSYILYTNFQSSKLQRVVYQEIMRGELRQDADMFIEGFPWIPNLSVWGESINALIARYLLNEERYEETIELLRDDLTNPFDGRREFFMATAFSNLNMRDSALHYAEKVYQVKPVYFRNIHLMTSLLERKTRIEEGFPYLEHFVSQQPDDRQGILYATSYFGRHGRLDEAWELIQDARMRMPEDSLVEQQYRYVRHIKFVAPHQELYARAAGLYNNRRFDRALPLLNEYIEKTPFDANVYRMRAFTHYNLGNYQETIEDVNEVLAQGVEDFILLNLRGVSYQNTGEQEKACEDFRVAMEAGNESGERNFRNFCEGRRE